MNTSRPPQVLLILVDQEGLHANLARINMLSVSVMQVHSRTLNPSIPNVIDDSAPHSQSVVLELGLCDMQRVTRMAA